jgi:hypothetical protein
MAGGSVERRRSHHPWSSQRATPREIAERLAITEKNASVRVSRARQTVKRYFGAEAG